MGTSVERLESLFSDPQNLFEQTRFPVTLDHWSHSQDQVFRRCPLKWYYKYVLGLTPVAIKEKAVWGAMIHKALQAFRAIEPSQRTREILIDVFEEEYRETHSKVIATEPDKKTIKDLQMKYRRCLSALSAYWDKYRQDVEIRPTLLETKLSVPIPGTSVQYEFIPDAYCRTETASFVVSTKTTFSRYSTIEALELHDLQIMREVWGLRLLGYPVDYICYDHIALPDSPSGLTELNRTRYQPSERQVQWAVQDLPLIVREAQREDKYLYHYYNRMCLTEPCEYALIDEVAFLGGDPTSIIEKNFR